MNRSELLVIAGVVLFAVGYLYALVQLGEPQSVWFFCDMLRLCD